MNITYSDHNKEFLHVVGDRPKHTAFINKIGGRWNKKLEPPGWILNNIFKKDLDTYIENFELKQIKKNKNKKNKICETGEPAKAVVEGSDRFIGLVGDRGVDSSERGENSNKEAKIEKNIGYIIDRDTDQLSPPKEAVSQMSPQRAVVDPIKSIYNKKTAQRIVKSNPVRGASVKSISNNEADLKSVKSDISENYRKRRGNILGVEDGFTGNEQPPLKAEDDIFYESENGSEYENGNDINNSGDYDSESKSYIKDKKSWRASEGGDTEKVKKKYESDTESDNENDTASLLSEFEDDREADYTFGSDREAASISKSTSLQSTAKEVFVEKRSITSQSKFGDDRGAASTKSGDRGAASTKGSDRNSAYSEYKKSELLNRYNNKKKFNNENKYSPPSEAAAPRLSSTEASSDRSSSSIDDNREYNEKRTRSKAFNDRKSNASRGGDWGTSRKGDISGSSRFLGSDSCNSNKDSSTRKFGGKTSSFDYERFIGVVGDREESDTASTPKAVRAEDRTPGRADDFKSKGGYHGEAAIRGGDRFADSTKGCENDNKRCEKCNRKIKKKKGSYHEAVVGDLRDEKEIKIDRNTIGTPPVSKFLYNGNKKKIYKSPAKSPNIFKNSNVYSYYNNNPVTKKKLYENLYKYNKGLSFPDSETEEDSEFDYESD